MKKILILILLLLLPLPLWAAEDSERELKAQQKDLTRKIQRYNELARQKAQESQTLLGRLSQLRRDAQESQARMGHLERENSRLKASMEEAAKDIESARKALNDLLPQLRTRVAALYKYGQPSVLLSASDAHDAVTTAYMLECFIRQDQRLAEELVDKVEVLARSRAKLEQEGEQVRTQSEELRRKRQEYGATIAQTDTLLKDIQKQRDKAQAAARELESAQRDVGNRILALTRRKQERAKAGQAASPAKPQSPAPVAKGTLLEWPVRGTISAPFGSRVHPVFKTKVFNSGIDIKAASGTPVKAAGPGEVLFKGWIRGFGQVVIVDHGTLSTVYAHLASASVSEGQAVQTGTILGRVGNSGADTEYGLHFEVRQNGSAQNPMNYLKKA